jgi:hypothetical protein
MTTKLPTKAQVEEALLGLEIEFRYGPLDTHDVTAISGCLVRAGLAEETREEGWYWVKWASWGGWAIWYFDGDSWKPSLGSGQSDGDPHITGPRIHPPKE